MGFNIPKFRYIVMSQNRFGIFHENEIFQNMTEMYVPDLKWNIPKYFKRKKYVPGARKVEPGLWVIN